MFHRHYFKSFGCFAFLFYFTSFAFANEITPISHLYIAQETLRHDGVWISRPQALHQEIADLIANNHIQSLEDYAQWLKNNIRYQNDGRTDTWTSPQETLRKKFGDCEDYAFLTATVMEVLGYKPHFLALVKNGRRAHAICTFEYNGHFLWFDNAQLKKTTVTSLEQLAKNLSEQYNYSALIELNLRTKNWNLVYKKS